MDLYRYFQPHHNPRLRNVPLRHQEIAELEQAAEELKRSLLRAQLRAKSAPVGGIAAEHFDDLLVALSYVSESLATLEKAHPGDDLSATLTIAAERSGVPGWETWAEVVKQRMLQVQNQALELEPEPALPAAPAKAAA